jgi:putative ABC transport system permease protein
VPRARALISKLKQEGYQVDSLEGFMEGANKIVVSITTFLGLIASVALLVASIGIANTMVMAVYERTREIGVLKALGASAADIRRLFMIEAGFIGLAGGVIGLFFGWATGLILDQGIRWIMKYRDMPAPDTFFVMTPMLALGVIGFATVIGLLAGLLPAQRAAALEPISALRHE